LYAVSGAVFISYARTDGEMLAHRLAHDLEERKLPVWLDRNEIAGAQSWTEAIERGIDGSQAALAILTNGSFLSNVCRAEQLRALRKGKRVIPLLADKNADRPLHLEHLNYRDFSDPRCYPAALETVLSDLTQGSVVALPYQYTRYHQRSLVRITVPPLPPHFVDRSGDLGKIREYLTLDAPDKRLIGIHGMGGLGKSVLAQAICNDDVVQDAFPDGIVWLGMNGAGLLEQLRNAGEALGDKEPDYKTLPLGSGRLRMLLKDKAALLVLDDVTEAAQLEPFRTDDWSAPRVRILFTTRDRSVGLLWAAEMVNLAAFTQEQSVELLTKWTARDDQAFRLVATRLGNHPLAVKIAGAILSEGVSVQEWFADVQRISEMRLDRYSKDPQTSLEACFDVSLARLPKEDQHSYYALGVLPKDSRIPFRLVTRLWQSLNPTLTEPQCRDLARALARRALIEINDDRLSRHNLLSDYAKERLVATRQLIPSLVGGLINSLEKDESWVVRELAVGGLARIASSSGLGVLLKAAALDDDIDVRLAALRALARIGDPRAIDGLIAVLREGYYETTLEAAKALASIGEPAILPLLAALPSMRKIGLCDAILALEWLGDPRALPALQALLGNPEVMQQVQTSAGIVDENLAMRACESIQKRLRQ
jgi:hypothetical protein